MRVTIIAIMRDNLTILIGSDFPMTPEKEQALKDYIKGIAQILYEETSPEAWMGEKFV